jgi:hypothetical protein
MTKKEIEEKFSDDINRRINALSKKLGEHKLLKKRDRYTKFVDYLLDIDNVSSTTDTTLVQIVTLFEKKIEEYNKELAKIEKLKKKERKTLITYYKKYRDPFFVDYLIKMGVRNTKWKFLEI